MSEQERDKKQAIEYRRREVIDTLLELKEQCTHGKQYGGIDTYFLNKIESIFYGE